MPYRLTPVAIGVLAANLVLAILIVNWFPRGLERRRLAADAAAGPRLYYEGEADRSRAGKGANPRLPMAVAAWERALARRPGYAAARLGIAKCRLDEGDPERAAKEYAKALKTPGASAWEKVAAQTGLGIAWLRSADRADAATAAKLREDGMNALIAASEEKGAALPDPCVSMAAYCLQFGDIPKAKAWVEEAERRSAAIPFSKESIPPYLLARGVVGGGPQAVQDWNSVLALDPTIDLAQRNLDQAAIPRLAKGEGDTTADAKTVEALPYVKAFFEGKPANPALKANLVAALCALGLNAYREGTRALEEGGRLSASPDAPSALEGRQMEARSFESLRTAMRRFEEGGRLAPDRADFLRNRTAAAAWLEKSARRLLERGGGKPDEFKAAAEEAAAARLEGLRRLYETARIGAGVSKEAAEWAQSLGLTIASLRLAASDRAGAEEAGKALPLQAAPETLRVRGILAYLAGRHVEARDLWKKARAELAKDQPKTWTHPEFDPVLKTMTEKPLAGPIEFQGGVPGPAGEFFPTRVAFRATVRNRSAAVPLDPAGVSVTLDGKPVEFVLTARHVYAKPVENLANGKHTAEIRVQDAFGNASSRTGEFQVDVTPPSLAFRTPEPGAKFDAKTAKFFNTGTIPIGFVVRDESLPLDRASIQCRVEAKPEKGPVPPAWVLVENGVLKRRGQASNPPPDLPLPAEAGDARTARMQFEPQHHLMAWGTYTVRVSAKDVFGNPFEDSWSFQVVGRSPVPIPEEPAPAPPPAPGP